MEKWIDLHAHTFYSDGKLSPSELVRYAREKGLAAIAVTDHDCITGIDEAIEAGKELGIEVIPGVELSAEYANKSIHMIGLYIDHHSMDMDEITNAAREAHDERCRQIINKLEQLGFHGLSYEELQSKHIMKKPTGPHFCDYLVEKGYAQSALEAREKYIAKGKAAYVEPIENKLTIPEAVSLIHNAGGIALWAHPILCRFEPSELEETVAAFKKMKVNGLEAYQSKHSKTEIQDIIGLAKKYDLLLSGGSDYHGNLDNDCELGTICDGLRIPYSILDKMKSIFIK